MSIDALKPAPVMDTVRFESEPPGAEAKTSSGQTCRTPCALALPVNAPITVTFSLNGYQTESEKIEPITASSGYPELRPNPVQVELTAAAPQPKSAKKPAVQKKKKSTAAPAPRTASAPPPPMNAGPPPQQAPAPWPPAPRQ
jgi:hypothetical protein